MYSFGAFCYQMVNAAIWQGCSARRHEEQEWILFSSQRQSLICKQEICYRARTCEDRGLLAVSFALQRFAISVHSSTIALVATAQYF